MHFYCYFQLLANKIITLKLRAVNFCSLRLCSKRSAVQPYFQNKRKYISLKLGKRIINSCLSCCSIFMFGLSQAFFLKLLEFLGILRQGWLQDISSQFCCHCNRYCSRTMQGPPLFLLTCLHTSCLFSRITSAIRGFLCSFSLVLSLPRTKNGIAICTF